MHVKHILYIQNGSTKALECLCIPHCFAKKFKSNSSKIESVLRIYLFNSAALNPANIQGNLINHFHFRSNKMRTVDSFAFLISKPSRKKKKMQKSSLRVLLCRAGCTGSGPHYQICMAFDWCSRNK